jgi:hypothetical protein
MKRIAGVEKEQRLTRLQRCEPRYRRQLLASDFNLVHMHDVRQQ